MRLSLMGSWVLKSTHGSSQKRMLLLMHNGTPLDLLNDVLFCSLEKFHFGGEAEALMGELCMLWPQYALRQLLYWWERMCERGETQSLVCYLVPRKCKISAWFSDFANFHHSQFLVMSSWRPMSAFCACYQCFEIIHC